MNSYEIDVEEGFLARENLRNGDSLHYFDCFKTSGPISFLDKKTQNHASTMAHRRYSIFDSLRTLSFKRLFYQPDAFRFSRVLYNLATDQNLATKMVNFLGEDIALYRCGLVRRLPGARRTWHIDPVCRELGGVHASIALTDMKLTNSCIRVIPNTHRYELKQSDFEQLTALGECDFSDDQSVLRLADQLHPENAPHHIYDLELEAGNFLLMRAGMWHCASPNTTSEARLALTVRYAPIQAIQHHNQLGNQLRYVPIFKLPASPTPEIAPPPIPFRQTNLAQNSILNVVWQETINRLHKSRRD